MLDFDDNTLLIVPDNLKQKVLLDISNKVILKNIKVMSITCFLHNYIFDYDEKTIYYLISHYHLNYDIALMYIKNLYYIEDKTYNSDKLNKLVDIKRELDKNQLLTYNNLFKEGLKRKKIIFYNFKNISKFNQELIDELNNITSSITLNETHINNYSHNIYELNNIEEELEFVATNICELINNGIDINNIVLLNVSDDYLNILKRIFFTFNIPINIKNNNNLFGTRIGQYFISNLLPDIQNTLNKVKDNFKLDNEAIDIYNKLISICNKYVWCDNYVDIKEMLIQDLKNTSVSDKTIDNAVKIEDIESYVPNNDDYVFLLNFNQGLIPSLTKDEDYIDDSIKREVNLETSVENNVIHSKNILELIKNIKNLWITYKNINVAGKIDISSLNEYLNYPIIHNNKINYNYSNLNNLLMLSKEMDLYLKYGIKSDTLKLLYTNYPNNNYRNYDNKFTGTNKTFESLTLSYSSLDNYFKCAFRYYLNSVLKINIYEENFTNYIGSLFHFVLSKKQELTLDEAWNKFIVENPKDFSNKELFFLNKLKKDLEIILDTINKQEEYTTFKIEDYEQKIEVQKDSNTKFVGIVDKLLFNSDKSLVSIIDYKTGNTPLDLNNLPYGLGMQLPIYLYLINNKYPNSSIVGFYLQKILPNLITVDPVKTLIDQKRNLLKLQGYSLSDEDKLKEFDKTYVDSSLIKSMKKGNNGFYSYSKTLTSNNISNIIKVIDSKIDEAITDIHDNKFDINPKQVGKENVGCSFCKFRDICYMNEKDIVKLVEIDNLDFLGGDPNAQMD